MQSNEDIKAIMHDTFKEIEKLRILKGGEYASGYDALDNFYSNARDCDTSPFLIWRIYSGKHWNAITTFIKDQIHLESRTRSEPIEGRIDDLINYLILLKGIITNELQK